MCTLKVTLWKHLKIRTSGYISIILTISEFVVPILIFLAVIYAKSNVGNFDKVYVNKSTHLEPIDNQNLLTRIDVGSVNILYAPDTQFTSSLIREAQLKLNLYNEDIKPFQTEEKLLECYNNYKFEGTTIVVLFKNEQHTTPQHLNYDIKIYEDGVIWNTNKLFFEDFKYIQGLGSENYLDKGFAAFQVALDISYIEIVTNKSFNTSLTFQEFPYPPHLDTDGVTTVFRHILPFITIISFIFICPVTLKRIVLEKSCGLKELLKISGVKSWMLWLGWFFNGILLNTVSVICIAFILTQKVFDVNYALIEHCNVFILMLFLILYCMATTTFLFAFSTLFHRGTLAMVLGVLLWIISYIIFIGFATNVDIMSGNIKALFSLLPTIALYYGFNAISIFEMREADITFCNIFESPTSSSDDISLGGVIIMLLIDTILYFILALYLDKIWPGPYGIAKQWYFLLEKPAKFFRRNLVTEVPMSNDYLLENYEKSQLKPLLCMRDVVKIYDNNVAVDNLTLDIYEGTITSLLGENGAGKSTTMAMLTGLTKATSGDIYIGNYQVNKNVEEARRKVSLCTQNNLLYDELTTMQHLILFGMLKGLSIGKAKRQAQELLRNTLNMEEKADHYANELSGGMKRKLSLGIALMGDPEILILDEPTSGVDIEGRNEIRDLILTFKGKKTILVSTHFLEEAERLSDHIAILDKGRLLCYGTPMYLKNQYNIGYNCLINFSKHEKIPEIKALMENYCKDIKESGKVIQCYVDNDMKHKIPALLRTLEQNKDKLEMKYKLTHSTLEDIYLKVQNKEKAKESLENMARAKDETDEGVSQVHVIETLRSMKDMSFSIFHKRYIFFKKKLLQYLALTMLFIFVVLLTLLLGESGYADVSKDGTKIPLNLHLYGNTDVYYSTTLGPTRESKIDRYFRNIILSENSRLNKVKDVSETIIQKGIENIAHYTKRMVIATEFKFNGDDELDAVNLMHSNKAIHGAPISINVAMNTLLKYFAGEDYSISASNTPLHSRDQKKQALNQSQATNLFLWLTLLPIGPLLLISTVLLLPTIEYSKNTRILERLCGISSLGYWILHFLWDYVYYVGAVSTLIALLMVPFHFLELDAIINLYKLLLLYGIASIPFAYIFTYTRTVEGAYAKFLIIHIICAPIVAAILLILEEVDQINSSVKKISYVLCVLDPHIFLCYLLSKFSVKIIDNHNWDIMPVQQKKFLCHEKPVPCCIPDSQECADDRAYNESNVYLMFVTLILYMIVLEFTDLFSKHGLTFITVLIKKVYGRSKDTLENTNQSILAFNNISRNYFTLRPFKRIRAVKNLSFKVEKGQCFGLLGVNGAGKSTSFRILTNEITQTTGTLNIRKGQMGYCPQQNALLDDFTGRELLQFYGGLRCPSENLEETIRMLLDKFGLTSIADRPCGTYSGGNKRKLSTCISVIGFPTWILLDEPTSGVDPVSRRELWDLIQQIKGRKENGIILTSHSMDECEALCDILCILKGGEADSPASIDELKDEYCKGHTLIVKFGVSDVTDGPTESNQSKNEDNFKEYLFEHFGKSSVDVLRIENEIIYFRIRDSNWPSIFEAIEKTGTLERYNIESYDVKEPSLEEVFMHVAKKPTIKDENPA